MKALLVVLALATLSGCRTATYLNPAYQDRNECVRDFPIAGVWIAEDDVYKVTGEGTPYLVVDSDGNRFNASIVRMKDILVLDLEPEKVSGLALPTHLLAKVWMEGDALCLATLDSEWLLDQLKPYAVTDAHDPLITAPTATIRAVLERSGNDARAVSETIRFKHPTAP